MTTDTTTTVDTRYVDPKGDVFELIIDPHLGGLGEAAAVTRLRAGEDREGIIATGPTVRLRQMLVAWAEAEGGELTGEVEVDGDVVVIPRITVPAGVKERADQVLARIERLRPEVEELHAAALEVREEHQKVLLQMVSYVDPWDDTFHTLAGSVTGWHAVWEKGTEVLGNPFSGDDGFDSTGLRASELARGGERDFEPGTLADVLDPDGRPTRARVKWVLGVAEEHYTCVDVNDPEKHYRCTHEELREGLVVE
jgi:hypothetical protein